MKIHSVLSVLCACVLLCMSLCACGQEPPASTVITKAPQDVVVRTQATTTKPTTTTTAPFFSTTDHASGTSPDGDTTAPTTVVINDSEASASGKAIAQLAVSLIGTPFAFGGTGPDAFDNPGFVVYCYKQNGFTVPNKASKMALWGEDVPPDLLQAGDVVLFANDIGGAPSFCGIYIGDEQFVACNNPDSPTKVQRLDTAYWGQRFVCARRPSETA